MPRGHVVPDGNSVASLRGEAGITQDELAARAGYGLRTIGKIESGQRTTAPTLAAIAIVLGKSLGRPIALADLLSAMRSQPRVVGSSEGSLHVGEDIRLLELPSARGPSSAEGRSALTAPAVLTNTVCLRNVSKGTKEIHFYYATAGKAVAGKSVSHPRGAEWIAPCKVRVQPASPAPAEACHELRVRIPAVGKKGRPLLQNCVEYTGGFLRPRQKWFYAHVAYPTDSLTLIVRFPDEQPFRSLRGLVRLGNKSRLVAASEKPISISAGRMAYWRIVAPRPGETYHLGWT